MTSITLSLAVTLMVAAIAAPLATATAHSGGLDKKGCHHDHKNGGYHCH